MRLTDRQSAVANAWVEPVSEASNEHSDQTHGQGAINQGDIDAVLSGGQSAVSDEAQADSANNEETPSTPDGGAASQADIDALLDGAEAAGTALEQEATPPPADEASTQPDTRVDSEGRPFDESAAAMAAAIEEQPAGGPVTSTATQPAPATSEPSLGTGQFELQEFSDSSEVGVDANRVSMLHDVNLRVEIELGRTRMLVEDVLQLGEGSVVELDKLAGDPVDVFVNDRLIARGEVLILNDSFCVRVSEVLSDDPHRI